MDEHSVVNQFGRRIHLDPSDSRGRALVKSNGDFNPLASQLWREALALRPRWDVVIDVGANYGEMLAGADLSVAGRVIAFEPNPGVADKLQRTIAGLPWDVELHRSAVGSTQGSVAFRVDDAWSGKSHVTTATDGHTLPVDMTTLDEVLATAEADDILIKIDVEGLELEVIEGMRDHAASSRLVVVMLEILHMSVQQVAVLTRSAPLFLLTAAGDRLVRVPTDDPLRTGLVLHDGSTHRENALMVLGTEAAAFVGRTPSLQHVATPGTQEESEHLRARLRVRERQVRELRSITERRAVRAAIRLADLFHRARVRRRAR